jgi:anti-anti-sigma regulatory factor
MLRITTDDNPRVLTLRLEGRLEGPWVSVADRCWQSEMARVNGKRVCVDLTDVTFISAAGKALLAEMHERGGELIAGDLMTKAIVSEIVEQNKGGSR